MRELVGFVLILATIGVSIWVRRRLGLALDYPFFLKLLPAVGAAGTTRIGVVYPFT